MKRLAAILHKKLPQFNTTTPHHALRDALFQLSCENLDYLIVLEDGAFAGILSEGDVAHKVFGCSKPWDELAVKDVMNTAIPVGSTDDDMDYSIRLLARYNSRYIAVFDGLEFKGIVSETDLLQQTIARMPARPEAAVAWSY